jgi:hypothetical protein
VPPTLRVGECEASAESQGAEGLDRGRHASSQAAVHRRNRVTLTRMVTAAQFVERYSPGGIYLGHGYALQVAPGVQERVIKRIVRGLYWHHFKNPLGADIHVSPGLHRQETTRVARGSIAVFEIGACPNW